MVRPRWFLFSIFAIRNTNFKGKYAVLLTSKYPLKSEFQCSELFPNSSCYWKPYFKRPIINYNINSSSTSLELIILHTIGWCNILCRKIGMCTLFFIIIEGLSQNCLLFNVLFNPRCTKTKFPKHLRIKHIFVYYNVFWVNIQTDYVHISYI